MDESVIELEDIDLDNGEFDEHPAQEPLLENCEVCGHLMPEECIGWCSDCDVMLKEDPLADFYAWGGWRRAFWEETEDDLYMPGTVCRPLRLVKHG